MPLCHDAVVAGHLCLDIIPDFAGDPDTEQFTIRPGRLMPVGPAVIATGGAVSNTGLALHRLGIHTCLMGIVGDDLFGQAVRQVVSDIDPRLADGVSTRQDLFTSYTIIIDPAGQDRSFLHCPGANDTFSARDVDYRALARARLFHFGYPPVMRCMYENGGFELVEMFSRARQTGVTTSLDMAFPDPDSPAGCADWRGILAATLPYVDLFLPSIEEALSMWRRADFDRLARAAFQGNILPLIDAELLSALACELLDLGPKVVALKLGDRGLYLRTADVSRWETMGRAGPREPISWAGRELWAPCFRVDVAGTTGAGDAIIAGFLAALLRDMPPESALRVATAVGACNVEAPDALSGLRSWEDTLRRIEEGWPACSLDVSAAGWHYDRGHGLWVGPCR